MTIPNKDAASGEFPKLRDQFEISKALVARARERAIRAAETARAMRTLLEAHHGLRARSSAPHADIWQAAAQQLMKASHERDTAFAVLSHELRQSLSAALAAERLVGAADTATGAKARLVLQRQLLHLMNLVDTVLDFSRLSLRSAALAEADVDVRAVVNQALETIQQSADDKQLQMSCSQPIEPEMVRGDQTRLLQVFTNLLQNAVRYTPVGGRICVSCERLDAWVRIMFEDNGRGIARDMQTAIFEPFVRGTEDGQGLGVGLALALRIVEMHGGRLSVRSDGEGRGSAFTVLLPSAPPSSAQ